MLVNAVSASLICGPCVCSAALWIRLLVLQLPGRTSGCGYYFHEAIRRVWGVNRGNKEERLGTRSKLWVRITDCCSEGLVMGYKNRVRQINIYSHPFHIYSWPKYLSVQYIRQYIILHIVPTVQYVLHKWHWKQNETLSQSKKVQGLIFLIVHIL